ncbi:malonyl-CoA O-methyltransferase [Natronocella acetinitrilica]|jgi:malonyl-CoA O-methyltransferase|uniref:Malonyl-[acyl-carrier protein] O-methyltransferase n=1 Tax=Natronocella acetinitrilica TaxID=414046 RepID=A0AAE3KC10_9GAMM|nr:malonyl-ACP O-methyltransferase BioC [Natronocella acetinitrilica]MCP1675216.1 malonyl-CoA O-methyltransferase [Natronocella acetinitrilica]
MTAADETWLDKAALRRSFDAAAATYDEAAVLQREVGERLQERLQLIRLAPSTVVDLGAGTGLGVQRLRERYRRARVLALDLSAAMLRRAVRHGTWLRPVPAVCADAECLPLADASVDMVFSNLTLQWCERPERVFAECRRVLRPGGLLMFSTLGPDTLRELRASWAAADDDVHVSPFLDMHDLGDMLVGEGFADPVMDMETLTLTYTGVGDLMRDLKAIGARNLHRQRTRGMTGRRRLQRMMQAYEQFRDPEGRLPATWEVVYGHAWAGQEVNQRRDEGGAVSVSLEAMRRTLRGGG